MRKIDQFLRLFQRSSNENRIARIIQELETLDDIERIRIEKWILTNVLNIPIADDILKRNENEIIVGGRKLSLQEVTQLRSEVMVLKRFRIWAILNANLLAKAHEMMIKNSESYEGMRGGKFIHYALDTQNNILAAVENPTFDEKMAKVVQSNRKNKI